MIRAPKVGSDAAVLDGGISVEGSSSAGIFSEGISIVMQLTINKERIIVTILIVCS